MLNYFEHPVSEEMSLEFDICETLLGMEIMKNFEETNVDIEQSAQLRMAYLNTRMRILMRTGAKLDLDFDLGLNTLRRRFNGLLIKANQTESEWLDQYGRPTEKYQNACRRLPFADLIRLRDQIRTILIQRKLEYGRLKNASPTQGMIFIIM